MHLGPRRTRAAAGLVGGTALVALLTACSWAAGEGPGTGSVAPAEPEPSAAALVREAAPPAATPRVELRSRVTRVAGDLSDVRRERVAARAHAAVERYLDGAFGPGSPTDGFVPGLRREARADRGVLVAGGDVEIARARAWFAVSAPNGRPVGLTARLAVDLADADGQASAAALTGRLLLTKVEGGWRVFGYDLARTGNGTGTRAGTRHEVAR